MSDIWFTSYVVCYQLSSSSKRENWVLDKMGMMDVEWLRYDGALFY